MIVAAFHLVALPGYQQTRRLASEGVETSAYVVAKDCSVAANPRIEYVFATPAGDVRGSSSHAACAHVRLGDQIFVTYWRRDASVNRPEKGITTSYWLGTVLSVVVFAGLVLTKLAGEDHRGRRKTG